MPSTPDDNVVPIKRKNSSVETQNYLRGQASPPCRFFGVLVRKERWSLSWRGWLIGSLIAGSIVIVTVLNVHSFLAVTDRIDANVLVVEGWVHEYAIRAAVKEFGSGAYRRVFTTGGPEEGTGGYINDFNTSASVGADLLKKDGLPEESVQMVPSHVMGRDRTFSSALALRDWSRAHNVPLTKMNIVTEGTHARRTRLLFQKAFGGHTGIGIIAISNPDYDESHWWRYSEGVKDVLSEGIAYLYAKFLFYPSDSVDALVGARTSTAKH